jgi:tRNA C32,U32 (ribose-2'-O)-methylase TrmJ
MLITIPANPTYPTLNISHAAAIIFYELHLKKTAPLKIILDPKLKERLMEEFHRLVDVSAIPVHRRKITENAFKNLINRSWMTRREATLIIGAFRRCLNVLAK